MTLIRLIQFRAAYNLPVHAALENGIFADGGLAALERPDALPGRLESPS